MIHLQEPGKLSTPNSIFRTTRGDVWRCSEDGVSQDQSALSDYQKGATFIRNSQHYVKPIDEFLWQFKQEHHRWYMGTWRGENHLLLSSEDSWESEQDGIARRHALDFKLLRTSRPSYHELNNHDMVPLASML